MMKKFAKKLKSFRSKIASAYAITFFQKIWCSPRSSSGHLECTFDIPVEKLVQIQKVLSNLKIRVEILPLSEKNYIS